MIVYVAHNGNPVKLAVIKQNADRLGLMFTPTDYRRNYRGRYALDNGAFFAYSHERRFDEAAFMLSLKKLPNPDFVVIPDKVAQGKKSLAYSITWLDFLAPYTFNKYLAVQDGMTPDGIPDNLPRKIDGIFVGGSQDWKDETAEIWVNYAHRHKLKAHIGRYGTQENLMVAERIGADSVDSSNFTRHERNWNELMLWLRKGQDVLPLVTN